MKGSAQPHLEQFFQQKLRTPATQASDDRDANEESLPSEDSPYVPYPLRSSAPEFSLVCMKVDGTMRGFQYAHLDSDSDFKPECITLRFMGLAAWQVTIHGRNLRQLYDYIHQHRTAFVREAARAHAEDDEPIITQITIAPVQDVENSRQD